MILEAKDGLGHVSYRFTHMESANVDNEIFDMQPDYKYVQLHTSKDLTWLKKQEFQKLWEES